VGNAGSGKSFLARALVARFALPVIDLDLIFWLDGIYGAAYEERTNDISRRGHQRLFDGFTGRRLRFENREQINSFIASFV